VRALVVIMVLEGVTLVIFSRMGTIGFAVASMVFFSLFVQMACGATYSVVPFINKRALGAVSGIVGAGGNVGAVIFAQYLLRSGAPLEDCFMYYGVAVAVIGLLGFGVRFSEQAEAAAKQAYETSAASAAA